MELVTLPPITKAPTMWETTDARYGSVTTWAGEVTDEEAGR